MVAIATISYECWGWAAEIVSRKCSAWTIARAERRVPIRRVWVEEEEDGLLEAFLEVLGGMEDGGVISVAILKDLND